MATYFWISDTDTCTTASGAANAAGYVFEIEYLGYSQLVIIAV